VGHLRGGLPPLSARSRIPYAGSSPSCNDYSGNTVCLVTASPCQHSGLDSHAVQMEADGRSDKAYGALSPGYAIACCCVKPMCIV
jgi:hypothetical protein